jgi:hypothetical protein
VSDATDREAQQRLEDETKMAVQNYANGVLALTGFIHEVKYQLASGRDLDYAIGPSMSTSKANRVAPCRKVTPDAALWVGPEYGVIVECKSGFPQDRSRHREELRQIEKYDDDLSGWPREHPRPSDVDIAVLVRSRVARPLANAMQGALEAGTIHIERDWAVVRYELSAAEAKSTVVLDLVAGGFSNEALQGPFRAQERRILEETIHTEGYPKFTDDDPPVAYTVWVMWDFVFSHLTPEAEYEERLDGAIYVLRLTVAEAHCAVVTRYGVEAADRQHCYPEARWVEAALDALVHVGWAELSDAVYRVSYQERSDSLAQFVSRWASLKVKADRRALLDQKRTCERELRAIEKQIAKGAFTLFEEDEVAPLRAKRSELRDRLDAIGSALAP